MVHYPIIVNRRFFNNNLYENFDSKYIDDNEFEFGSVGGFYFLNIEPYSLPRL